MLVGAVKEGKLTAVAGMWDPGCKRRWRCRYEMQESLKTRNIE